VLELADVADAVARARCQRLLAQAGGSPVALEQRCDGQSFNRGGACQTARSFQRRRVALDSDLDSNRVAE
jgi:hypothetical protein